MTTSKTTAALFQPFEVGNLKLDNRIVMAPMTRTFPQKAFQVLT